MSLTERILARARELGFERAGVAPAEPLPHGEAFRDWLDVGYAGEMRWMEGTRDLRDVPTALLEPAQTIVAVAVSYRVEEPGGGLGEIARYARGYDYHRVMEHKLEELGAFIRAESGAEARTRAAVDRLPLLERDVAYLAGIGWYGKNTMVMDRSAGSYLFLGELLVDADLEVNAALPRSFCGSCTACLDACPTGALVAPFVLDARRCISYLTIELRGPIPRELRRAVGSWLYGCDICQEVCPWNLKAPLTREFAYLGRPDITGLRAEEALVMEEATFRARFTLSAIQRAQRGGLARNAAVVLGNTGDRRWVPLLAARLVQEGDPLVRGHVAWALGELGGLEARATLDRRWKTEPDAYVREEIRQALQWATSATF